jgi:hypothetical protein
MTGLFDYLDKNFKPKVYILKLGNFCLAKIGYTEQEINKYIRTRKFSGKYRGMEKDLEIFMYFEHKRASTIEYYVKKMLNQKMVKADDKNLGAGYTEWFICEPEQIWSYVLHAFKYLERKEKVKKKDFNNRQLEMDF